MKKALKDIFEFLFFCLYEMFRMIKRIGVRDESLAAYSYAHAALNALCPPGHLAQTDAL